MMTTELLPCPFCASDARLAVKKGSAGITCTPYYRAYVYCKSKKCAASTKVYKRPGQAEASWNTRLQKAGLHGVEFKIKRDCTANVQQDEELEAYKQKLHDMEKKWVAWIWGE